MGPGSEGTAYARLDANTNDTELCGRPRSRRSERDGRRLALRERVPGVEVGDIFAATDAELHVAGPVPVMPLEAASSAVNASEPAG